MNTRIVLITIGLSFLILACSENIQQPPDTTTSQTTRELVKSSNSSPTAIPPTAIPDNESKLTVKPPLDLITAITQDNLVVINQHLKYGTNVNENFVPVGYDFAGGSALHIAILEQNEEVVLLLLNNGADINIQAKDSYQGTPLEWAAYWGIVDMVLLLIEQGANINSENSIGGTPLDAATVDNLFIPEDEIEEFKKSQVLIREYLILYGGTSGNNTSSMSHDESTTNQTSVTKQPTEHQASPCDEVEEEFRSRCELEIANDPSFGGSGSSYVRNFDPNKIPKIAKFNFTELDKLGRTSKFRSVTGHDFSFNTSEYDSTGINCRSMKHYMIPVGVPRENAIYHLTPHTFEWMSIKFFAPADGTIGNVVDSESHGEFEQQFTIGSTEYPGYYFGFYHVKLDPSLRNGSEVKAGQQIGTLGNEESYAEISVEARINSREIHLFSFLEVATDEVFEEYRARGVNSVSDVIITKEERDANPIACDRNSEAGWFAGSYKYKPSEAFMTWVFESSDNWFFFDE